jgi:AraC family transcriptional regulator
MPSESVKLAFHNEPPRPDAAFQKNWGGFQIDSVRIGSPRGFGYSWQGDANYLALHDILLADGEIDVGGEVSSSLTDLRDRLTFVPNGVQVSGWSQLAGRDHGFTAMVFDPLLAEAEIERPLLEIGTPPLLYFEQVELSQTLRRIDKLASSDEDEDPLTGETLCLLAVLQLYSAFSPIVATSSGQLSVFHQKQIQEFIEAHLSGEISLSDLANIAGLSRFHFARSFSRTYGRSPHQHVLMHRIGRAATLLATTRTPIGEIAVLTGFSSPARLSTAFRRMIGRSPRQFRAAIL